jgi:hypothetical protein
MSEVNQYTFSSKEVAEALIKQQGLHEGTWGIYVEFSLAAGNIPDPTGNPVPAAIVPITKLGIQRFAANHPLAVNAAEVNPQRTLKKK